MGWAMDMLKSCKSSLMEPARALSSSLPGKRHHVKTLDLPQPGGRSKLVDAQQHQQERPKKQQKAEGLQEPLAPVKEVAQGSRHMRVHGVHGTTGGTVRAQDGQQAEPTTSPAQAADAQAAFSIANYWAQLCGSIHEHAADLVQGAGPVLGDISNTAHASTHAPTQLPPAERLIKAWVLGHSVGGQELLPAGQLLERLSVCARKPGKTSHSGGAPTTINQAPQAAACTTTTQTSRHRRKQAAPHRVLAMPIAITNQQDPHAQADQAAVHGQAVAAPSGDALEVPHREGRRKRGRPPSKHPVHPDRMPAQAEAHVLLDDAQERLQSRAEARAAAQEDDSEWVSDVRVTSKWRPQQRYKYIWDLYAPGEVTIPTKKKKTSKARAKKATK